MIIIPDHYRLELDGETMHKEIVRLGREIEPWAESAKETTGQQLLALCILRGGAIFFADLIRAIPTSVEQAFCRARSYISEANASAERGVHVDIYDAPVEGRVILMVDDICDTGATLTALKKELLKRGAIEVREATLIYRKVKNSNYTPAWSAMTYEGPEWLVGSGLEDKNHNSNLAEVYSIGGSGV